LNPAMLWVMFPFYIFLEWRRAGFGEVLRKLMAEYLMWPVSTLVHVSLRSCRRQLAVHTLAKKNKTQRKTPAWGDFPIPSGKLT